MVKHIPTITIKDEGRPPWFDSEVINLGKKKGRLHKNIRIPVHQRIMLDIPNVEKN